MRSYARISAVFFGFLAAGHIVRFMVGWPLVIGELAVPLWASAVAAVLLGALAVSGSRLFLKSPVHALSNHQDQGIPEAQSEAQYDALLAVRNAELQAYWTRYNVQVVLNGGIIVAVLALDPDQLQQRAYFRGLAYGGMALGAIWFIMVLQGKAALHRWDRFVSIVEGRLHSKGYSRVFSEVSASPEGPWDWIAQSWNNITMAALFVPLLCIFFWSRLL